MLDNQSEIEDDDREEELSRLDTPTTAAAGTARPPAVVRSSSCSSRRVDGRVAAWVTSDGRSLSYSQYVCNVEYHMRRGSG